MTDSLLQVPDAMVAPATWPASSPAPVELALPTKYELDPFQKHAVLGIHAGDHVFVTAKTGSGKTFVGEYLCARALAAGKRVFYTTPIKSLSNQKYHDLKRLFPDATVGILTGDIKMCPDAQIVVMTAEILRNLFYKRGTATEGVGLTAAVSLDGVAGIVMDEVHYIQDPDRGHVWEESLILCPRDLQLVLLSATMPSATALAGWLANLHGRRTWLLSTTYRIVPLVHGVLEPVVNANKEGAEGWRVRPLLDSAGYWIGDGYTGWLRNKKAIADAAEAHRRAVKARDHSGGGGPGQYWNRGDHDRSREAAAEVLRAGKVRVEGPVQRLHRTIDWLRETEQLPALFFVFSRRECERLAGLVTGSLIDSSDSAAAAHIFDFHLSRYRATLEKSPQYHQVRELALRGVAFHHSGLQPLLKEIVELLFVRGYIKVLFATETFAVGLNMPTKTVIFLEMEKYSDGGRRPLRPDEYIQMAGRAGRRGLDTRGLVLYEPMRDPVDAYVLRSILTGALPALESRMRFGYEFVLRLHLMAAAGRPLPLAEQSYWAVQRRATRTSLGRELADLEERLAVAEKSLPADQQALLAEKAALEAEIAGSVNAKRKKATAALRAWEMENMDRWGKGQLAAAEQRFAALREARAARDRMAADVAAWDAAPLLDTAGQEECLKRWELLEEDGALTPMGRAATEVNEGHPILMSWLAFSDMLAGASAEEIACVLAAFLHEGSGRDEEGVEPVDLGVDATAALAAVTEQARIYQEDEGIFGTSAGVACDYWTLSRLWPTIVKQWMDGRGLSTIASEMGLMEGNVLRGLLKVANLLEEWGAVATLRRDLPTLEKLAGLRFLRDEVVVDSIYLRL